MQEKQHEEEQYLRLVRSILDYGAEREDRTGTGTFSQLGVTMRFSLYNGILPLITTRRMFWRGIAEELFWFISGSTDAKVLAEKGIHIWDANGSRANLDALGFKDREEGDLGPVYGFQWRHFGAKYRGCNADYKGEGVDQLQSVIDELCNNPNSRRVVLTAYNPMDLPLMVLPPCHMFCQFIVVDKKLSCVLYQRSGDMGLGVPFNIASYALLTHLIAHVCGLEAEELVHVIGDAHVYKNHVDGLAEQLARSPLPFPRLTITKDTKDIDALSFEDIRLEQYQHCGAISLPMSL